MRHPQDLHLRRHARGQTARRSLGESRAPDPGAEALASVEQKGVGHDFPLEVLVDQPDRRSESPSAAAGAPPDRAAAAEAWSGRTDSKLWVWLAVGMTSWPCGSLDDLIRSEQH